MKRAKDISLNVVKFIAHGRWHVAVSLISRSIN